MLPPPDFPSMLLPSLWLIGPSFGDLAELIVCVSNVFTFWRGSMS